MPRSIKQGQLYGENDEGTQEWTVGPLRADELDTHRSSWPVLNTEPTRKKDTKGYDVFVLAISTRVESSGHATHETVQHLRQSLRMAS